MTFKLRILISDLLLGQLFVCRITIGCLFNGVIREFESIGSRIFFIFLNTKQKR